MGDRDQAQFCGGVEVWGVSPGPHPGPIWLREPDGLMPIFSEQTN